MFPNRTVILHGMSTFQREIDCTSLYRYRERARQKRLPLAVLRIASPRRACLLSILSLKHNNIVYEFVAGYGRTESVATHRLSRVEKVDNLLLPWRPPAILIAAVAISSLQAEM